MNLRHRWLLNGYVAHFSLSEPPSNPQEAQSINAKFVQYLDAGTKHGVHLIVDVRQEGDLMPDIKSMLRASFVQHEKIISLILICHRYQVQRMVGDVLSRKGRIYHSQVNNFEDAITQLQVIDPHLPDLSQVTETTPEFITEDAFSFSTGV